MPHLPVYSTEVGGPVVHQAAPTLEEITARIRCLGGVLTPLYVKTLLQAAWMIS